MFYGARVVSNPVDSIGVILRESTYEGDYKHEQQDTHFIKGTGSLFFLPVSALESKLLCRNISASFPVNTRAALLASHGMFIQSRLTYKVVWL
jgi:hypothetical protein